MDDWLKIVTAWKRGNEEMHELLIRLRRDNEKLQAELGEMKSELYSAKDSAEYWMKSAKTWQRWHERSSAREDAWKELCGRWIEWAKEWTDKRFWLTSPPEKPEGL